MALLQMTICNNAYGQVNKQDTVVLLKAFKELTSEGQVVYVDTVNKERIVPVRLKEVLQKGKVAGRKKLGQTSSLTLTKAEQKYLIEQIGQTAIWSENLFADSKRIDSDSMWVFLKKENTKRRTSINQAALSGDTITQKKLSSHFTFVFTFTKPIYIRDNTICLISYTAICGVDCGRNETSFYKKENNEWRKWIIVSEGDF